MSKILVIIILFTGCGKENSKCRTNSEMKLLCTADAVHRWAPGVVPQYEIDFCKRQYPGMDNSGCY